MITSSVLRAQSVCARDVVLQRSWWDIIETGDGARQSGCIVTQGIFGWRGAGEALGSGRHRTVTDGRLNILGHTKGSTGRDARCTWRLAIEPHATKLQGPLALSRQQL